MLLAILVDSYAAATDQLNEEFGGDSDKIPSLMSDIGEIIMRSLTFGAVSDHTLTTVLQKMEDDGVVVATPKEVLAAIPPKVVSVEKITAAKIARNASVVMIEIDPEADKRKKEEDYMKEALEKIEESGGQQSRQDKMEAALREWGLLMLPLLHLLPPQKSQSCA